MGGHYKDSLFRSLFSERTTLLELYNAISGENLSPDTEIVINTLEETLFTVRKNDVSFSFQDRLVVLFDHQASISENMPLRFLEPVFRLFENSILDKKAIYRSKRIKLPWPEFIVLYNGEAPYPEDKVERLSEAFAPPPKAGQDPNLELIAHVYNINAGMNQKIAEKCRTLRDYSAFVAKEREIEKTRNNLAACREVSNFSQKNLSSQRKFSILRNARHCALRLKRIILNLTGKPC